MTTAYYPGWAIYGRNHFLKDIDLEDIDEIVYAFFDVEADGQIRIIDPYEWSDKAFTASESVSGAADTWDATAERGNQHQFALLSEANPDLKLTVALGGWTLSDQFSTAVTDENRANFVQNVVQLAKENPWINGFDMDWEFPGSGGQDGNTIRQEDGKNYANFLQELQEALDILSSETGHHYDISVASPPGLGQVETFGFDLGVAEHADTINFMAYDYHGGWEANTGLQAGMFDTYSGNTDLGIAATMQAMIDKGVDTAKVQLGIPLYARGWVIQPETPIEKALGATSLRLADGSFEKGVYDAKDILTQIEQNPSAWEVAYHTEAMAAFAYNPSTGVFASIETRSTVALKTAWAKENGLKGIMFWDSSGDYSEDGKSLAEASHDVWTGEKTVADVMATDPINFDLMMGDGSFYDMLMLNAEGQILDEAEAQSRVHEQFNATSDEDADSGTLPLASDGDNIPGGSVNDETDGETDTGGETVTGGETATGGASETFVGGGKSIAITWAWDQHAVIDSFMPETDQIDLGWMQSASLKLSANPHGDVVISIPSNSQSYTLKGISPDELGADNFRALDSSMKEAVADFLGDHKGTGDTFAPGDDSSPGTGAVLDDDPSIAGDASTSYTIGWNWGNHDIIEFHSNDVLGFGWMNAQNIEFSETHEGISISVVGNQQTLTLEGVKKEDLNVSNFQAEDQSLHNEIHDFFSDHTAATAPLFP